LLIFYYENSHAVNFPYFLRNPRYPLKKTAKPIQTVLLLRPRL